MATRWGICGTGFIANDFATVLKALPASEHQVVAVAAKSDQAKADAFAQKHNIPAAYGTYEDMAKDINVEIVYIGTTHRFHKEASIMYLDHGKHVLCEKPVTMNLKECEEVTAKAREKKLFFMEGFWTRFFPANMAMMKEVSSGNLGDITCVRTALCAPGRDHLASLGKTFVGGALLGFGCYPIMFIQQIFKERPEKVVAVGQFLEGGGEVGAAVTLQYKGGQLGIAYLHVDAAQGGSTATIHGTKGTVTVHGESLHTPTKMTSSVTGESHDYPLPDIKGPFNWWNSNGFVYQAQAVRQCLLEGLTECPQMTLEDSLTVMYILEEARKQLGLL